LEEQKRAQIYEHDLRILNEAADRLNAEMEDVLKDQALDF